MGVTRRYEPEPTLLKFHQDRDKYKVRFIRSVPGSGKSVGCLQECLLWAIDQKPHTDNVRYTRFAVVRATYPALRTTTLKTWKQWFPEDIWPVKASFPMECTVKFDMPDGTKVNMEMIFIAVETEVDAEKLKSLELTGAFGNEAFQLDYELVTTLIERTGRYPPPWMGGSTRSGAWFDTNSPNAKHWWAVNERNPPEGWKFYKQPAPLIRVRDADGNTIRWDDNPEAENIRNLAEGYDYYRKQIPGLSEEKIKVNIENEFGSVFEGKAVYAGEFREDMLSPRPLFLNPEAEILVGMDTSGLNPACVFGQIGMGKLAIFAEILALDTAFDTFIADMFLPMLATRFPRCPVRVFVDPSNPRDARTGMTPLRNLLQNGIQAQAAPTNNPKLRINAVKHFMGLHQGFVVDPSATWLRDALLGGYHFPKLRGTEMFSSKPAKTEHAHVAEALEYLCVGLRRTSANTDYDDVAAAFKAKRGGGRRSHYRFT